MVQKNNSAEKDAQKVAEYMASLDHPMKAEIEALRVIIKECSPTISERIKWNAPSYYSHDDMLTFHLRGKDQVMLVFHHISVVSVHSPMLEGDYKDRRLAVFKSLDDVLSGKEELQRIIREMLTRMNL